MRATLRMCASMNSPPDSMSMSVKLRVAQPCHMWLGTACTVKTHHGYRSESLYSSHIHHLLSAFSSTVLPFATLFCLWTGEKLIEHLKKWLDTTKLLETPHSWEPGQESDIAAAILELFHLLPQQASKFLETQGVSNSHSTALTAAH